MADECTACGLGLGCILSAHACASCIVRVAGLPLPLQDGRAARFETIVAGAHAHAHAEAPSPFTPKTMTAGGG